MSRHIVVYQRVSDQLSITKALCGAAIAEDEPIDTAEGHVGVLRMQTSMAMKVCPRCVVRFYREESNVRANR